MENVSISFEVATLALWAFDAEMTRIADRVAHCKVYGLSDELSELNALFHRVRLSRDKLFIAAGCPA